MFPPIDHGDVNPTKLWFYKCIHWDGLIIWLGSSKWHAALFKFLSHLLEPQAQKGKWKQVKSPSTWHSHYFRCVALKDIVIMTTGSHREGNDAGLFCIATDLSCVLWQNSLKDFFKIAGLLSLCILYTSWKVDYI